ncbi:MAG TPA: hypothetical protein VFD51_03155 [Patescibacteria group bacterium]|nr:hypothetical protein [Patescibacteria group bacterium]
MKINYKKILYFVLAILFGLFMFVYGEFDDSPGAQLIGLIVFIIGVIGLIINRKKVQN